MLDEFIIGGEVQETSKKNVLKAIAAQDLLQEVRICFLRQKAWINRKISSLVLKIIVQNFFY